MQNRVFNFLVGAAIVLFVLVFAMLSFFNRFAADDYQLLYERFHYGLIDAPIYQYLNWCGRWLPLTFCYALLSVAKWDGFLFAYGLLTLGTFILASFRFFRLLSNHYLPYKISSSVVLGYSILFIACFYWLTPQKAEVWFWYNSTTMYLWNIIAFLFGASFLVIPDKGRTELLIVLAAFAYVGAASEPFAVVIIGILTAVIAYKAFFRGTYTLKYLIALGALIISFFISISAQGNVVRASFLPPSSGWVAVHNTLHTLQAMAYPNGIKVAGMATLFFAVWIVVGASIPTPEFNPIKAVKPKLLLVGFILFAGLTTLIIAITAYALGGPPPERVLGGVYFMLACYVTAAGLHVGMALNNVPMLRHTGIVSVGVLVMFSGYYAVKQFSIAGTYAHEVDVRNNLLEMYNEQGFEDVVYVSPLPDPGALYSAEVSTDPTYFTNVHLKSGKRLGFDVVLKK